VTADAASSFNEARYGKFDFDRDVPVLEDRMVVVLDLIRGLGAKRILDVGCTDGFLSEKFRAMGMYTVGVDASPGAVESAKAKGRVDEAYVADLGRQPLPLPDGSVDLVWAGEIIEHIFDTEAFIDDLKRVLAPGGRLVLSTPNLASWINRISLLLGQQPFFTEVGVRPSNSGSFLRKVTTPAGHIRVFTPSSLRHLLKAGGWEVESLRGASILTTGMGARVDRVLGRVVPSLATDMICVCRKPA
jgi:2-polyprenyl-3-methyl-5-hydroxy-6-metoxy-1,4-benzoquinol methylase